MAKYNLIHCGSGDGLAPWSIVCEHLMMLDTTTAIRVPLREDDLREVDGDYVCSSCYDEAEQAGLFDDDDNETKKKQRESIMKKLHCICIHCMRRELLPRWKIIDEQRYRSHQSGD